MLHLATVGFLCLCANPQIVRRREGIMHDKNVSLRSVIAYSLWLVGITLVVLDVFGLTGTGDLGVVIVGVGALLQIRGYFLEQAERDRNAFELGRDHERHLRSLT